MPRLSAASVVSFAPDSPAVSKTPVIGSVVAGFPSPAEQYLEPALSLNAYLIRHEAATFLMRVVGDSMRDDGIFEGDILVVDRSLPPKSGAVIVAAVDGEHTVKRYVKSREGVRLVPANPAYPVISLTRGQQMDYFGTVVGVVRRLS